MAQLFLQNFRSMLLSLPPHLLLDPVPFLVQLLLILLVNPSRDAPPAVLLVFEAAGSLLMVRWSPRLEYGLPLARHSE